MFKGLIFLVPGNTLGRDSSVGIATCYGLDGPGIEYRYWRDFTHLSRHALGHTQHPIKWVPGLSRGVKAAGAWCWPPTPSSAEVKERVDLHIYSPFGFSWPVLGWNLPLPLLYLETQVHVIFMMVVHEKMFENHWSRNFKWSWESSHIPRMLGVWT